MSRSLRIVAGLPVVVFLGCGDGPFGNRNFIASPDTAVLYALARPELGLPSAFDFVNGQTVRVESPEATGLWDVALDRDDADLVLLPPSALGIPSGARIARIADATFDAVREAPEDTARFTRTEPVAVRMGSVYVIRTRERPSFFGTRCFQFAKLAPLSLDLEIGLLEFVWDANPFCNDRRLAPEDGS